MLTFRVYLLKESESARKFKRTLSRRHQNLLCGKTISNGKFCSGKYRRSCVFCLARKPLHQMKNEWSQLMIVVILQTIILQIVQEDYIFFRAKTIKTLYNEYIGRQCVYLREECIQWCLPWTDYQMIDITLGMYSNPKENSDLQQLLKILSFLYWPAQRLEYIHISHV